jgi:hypothetical protein
MGMFDNVICKRELPLNEELKSLGVQWDKVVFQTKDLDNCLSDYIITEDGELVEDVKKYEYTYYTEEEIKQRVKENKWLLVKDTKLIEQYNKKVNYHGKILFYEIFNFSDTEDIWVDFEAYFVYGKLDKIELVKTEKQEARSIRMDQWWEEQEKRKNSWNYKLKTYSGWYWGWKQLSNFFYNGSKLFGNLQTFAIRRLH